MEFILLTSPPIVSYMYPKVLGGQRSESFHKILGSLSQFMFRAINFPRCARIKSTYIRKIICGLIEITIQALEIERLCLTVIKVEKCEMFYALLPK